MAPRGLVSRAAVDCNGDFTSRSFFSQRITLTSNKQLRLGVKCEPPSHEVVQGRRLALPKSASRHRRIAAQHRSQPTNRQFRALLEDDITRLSLDFRPDKIPIPIAVTTNSELESIGAPLAMPTEERKAWCVEVQRRHLLRSAQSEVPLQKHTRPLQRPCCEVFRNSVLELNPHRFYNIASKTRCHREMSLGAKIPSCSTY